jgi:type VI secretion system protein ImpC
MLKIRFMNISKQDSEDAEEYKGRRGIRARCSRRSTRRSTGSSAASRSAALVGDYYFDQTPPDAELLGEMSKVAAAAHTPFIAGASPTVMQMTPGRNWPIRAI